MQYLTLLYGPGLARPGTPEWDADHPGYGAFALKHGPAVVAGEGLDTAAPVPAVTVRPTEGGAPLVTDGPFAEVVETLGGFYVLEADTLDDAIEMAAQIPATSRGVTELRPLVMSFDSGVDDPRPSAPAPTTETPRWLALLVHEHTAPTPPDTPEWDEGSAAHGRFGELAGADVRGGAALHLPETTTTVRVRDGEVLVTDGPYTEGIEVLGGLYLFRTMDRSAAVALAAQIPSEVTQLHPIRETAV
jgi:hypothetical protein